MVYRAVENQLFLAEPTSALKQDLWSSAIYSKVGLFFFEILKLCKIVYI